jgi:hypothetical protein
MDDEKDIFILVTAWKNGLYIAGVCLCGMVKYI